MDSLIFTPKADVNKRSFRMSLERHGMQRDGNQVVFPDGSRMQILDRIENGRVYEDRRLTLVYAIRRLKELMAICETCRGSRVIYHPGTTQVRRCPTCTS